MGIDIKQSDFNHDSYTQFQKKLHKNLEAAQDPQLTPELNRYNLEYNLTPYAINDKPFSSTEQDIVTQLHKLNHLAQQHQGRITLTPEFRLAVEPPCF